MTSQISSIKPKLGLFDLSMLVVSLVIGVGIFRTPAIVAAEAGHPDIFWAAWLTGGFISLCGALTFAEIGSRYPVAGGLYKVISHCYHPMFAFMLNWALLITYGAGAAGVAMIGAEYLNPLLPDFLQGEYSVQATVVAVVLVLFGLNYLGIKSGAKTQNILSMSKIILILLVCLGVFAPGLEASQPMVKTAGGWNIFTAFGLSLIAVFYTYGGYQQTMNFGEDAKNPSRNIPQSIMIGIAIIIGLYLTVNYSYYHVLGFERLSTSKLVAAEVTEAIFGPWGFKLTSIAIFLSTVGFVNATIMSVPRMYLAMSQEGLLPKAFGAINPATMVQEFTLSFFTGIILLSVFLLGTFEKILNYVMFIDSIALVAAATTIFVLRKRGKGQMFEGYRLRFFPLVPLLFIGFLLMVTVNVAITDTIPALIGTLIFLAGYPLFRWRKK
jgi:APA family basic amino acid/polyamine antiporter